MKTLYIVFLVVLFLTYAYLIFNRARILGKWGEKKVSTILCLLGKEYKVYNDVLIRNDSWTSQIDHLVVSPYGLFVIETKNYKGWIYGGPEQERWTQNIWGYKNTLVNPIRQNRGHIIALRKTLPVFCNNQYKSIIVFSSNADLKTSLPEEYNVIYTWQLLSRIRSYNERILTSQNIAEFTACLISQMITDGNARKSHVSNVKENIRRKESHVHSGKCPRCGGVLILRKGRYGSFYGCSNYPKCTFTAKC